MLGQVVDTGVVIVVEVAGVVVTVLARVVVTVVVGAASLGLKL
jgi:hypothetical protein